VKYLLRYKQVSTYIYTFDLFRFPSFITAIDLLCLYLLVEKLSEVRSSIFPYIQILPKTFNTLPLYENIDPASSILPRSCRLAYEKQSEEFSQSLNRSRDVFDWLMANKLTTTCCDSNDQTEQFSDLYKWAWCTVNTRCIYKDCTKLDKRLLSTETSGDCLALVPYLDMINHTANPKVYICIYSLCTYLTPNVGIGIVGAHPFY